jgi:PAS domain S-box-containing protein
VVFFSESENSWKIVLIDDESGIRKVMSINLEDAGYEVATAADGESGLRLCEVVRPQIVITDIRMPKMDGLQVLEALKMRAPEIEVIVVTAFGEMDLAVKALQLDASDFITKPVNDDALFWALERAQKRYISRKQLQDYTHLLEKGWAHTAQELMRTFSFQENLIEGSIDGILGCDATGKIVTYNNSLKRMLGYAKKDVIGQMTFDALFPAGESLKIKQALAGDRFGGPNHLFLYETFLKKASGANIPVQMSAAALFDQDQKSGLVCFFRDLREIRKLEQEIADQARVLHQDKMMSLGRLAASVVHEINNPLAGILNYARLMNRVLSRGPLQEAQRDKFQRYLDLVENETHRCSQIVSSLLSFSRKSPPSFGDIQIAELIERCVLLSRHKLELQHIELQMTIEPDLPGIKGDFNQLQQCLINLIFNAIDAMDANGTLEIGAHVQPDQNRVTIYVSDTGPGISEQDLPHIFEPFYTTKKEGYGVGLGLSTVFGIIKRHNGTVEAINRADRGATFKLHLPF